MMHLSHLFLLFGLHYDDLLWFFLLFKYDLLFLLVHVQVETADHLGSLANLTTDSDRTCLGDDSRVRVRLLYLAALLKFHFLDSSINYLFYELVSVLVLVLVVVGLALIWQNYIGLLRAGGVLDGVAPSDALAILNHMVLGGGVLH